MVWYSHLFQNFPQFIVIHTVKGFGIVNKAEIDAFLESLAFPMIQRMLAIWSLVPLLFLNPAWTSGSSQFSIAEALENFEHYFASMWDECNCVVVWEFFGIAFLWDWNENWHILETVIMLLWTLGCRSLFRDSTFLTKSTQMFSSQFSGFHSFPIRTLTLVKQTC